MSCTVLEAKRRMTRREFRRWAEYERLEPFGDYWTVQHGAVLVAAVLNATKGRSGRTYRPADFLPKPPPRRLNDADILRLKKILD